MSGPVDYTSRRDLVLSQLNEQKETAIKFLKPLENSSQQIADVKKCFKGVKENFDKLFPNSLKKYTAMINGNVEKEKDEYKKFYVTAAVLNHFAFDAYQSDNAVDSLALSVELSEQLTARNIEPKYAAMAALLFAKTMHDLVKSSGKVTSSPVVAKKVSDEADEAPNSGKGVADTTTTTESKKSTLGTKLKTTAKAVKTAVKTGVDIVTGSANTASPIRDFIALDRKVFNDIKNRLGPTFVQGIGTTLALKAAQTSGKKPVASPSGLSTPLPPAPKTPMGDISDLPLPPADKAPSASPSPSPQASSYWDYVPSLWPFSKK